MDLGNYELCRVFERNLYHFLFNAYWLPLADEWSTSFVYIKQNIPSVWCKLYLCVYITRLAIHYIYFKIYSQEES